MKKLRHYFYILLVLVIFTSCGNEEAILNDIERPFIVESISKYNGTHSSYYCEFNANSTTKNHIFGSRKGRVILPTGMFNVGDTIVLSRSN